MAIVHLMSVLTFGVFGTLVSAFLGFSVLPVIGFYLLAGCIGLAVSALALLRLGMPNLHRGDLFGSGVQSVRR
jgi:hypothetical protein